jgi:hypothetical protein
MVIKKKAGKLVNQSIEVKHPTPMMMIDEVKRKSKEAIE